MKTLFTHVAVAELQKLIALDKFGKSVWLERGLNPSGKRLRVNFEKTMNQAIKRLLELPSASSKSEIINSLQNSLLDFDQYNPDTEEKELIADYFADISQKIDVSMNKELNIWMYGFDVTIEAVPIPIETVNTISTACSKCATPLTADILKKRQNIQPFWLIVECNNCKELNLLSMPENVDRYRQGKYFIFENLKKTDYSFENAIEKLQFYKIANVE